MHIRRLTAVGMAVMSLGVVACGSESSSSDTAGGSGGSSDPIKVGALQDLSGPVGAYGQAEMDGTKLAVKLANAEGGVAGRQIELVEEDLKSDKAVMPTAMRKLASDGAVALVGPTSSTTLVVGAPVAQQLEIPLIAPSSVDTFPEGTLNEWTFRIAPVASAVFTDVFGKMQQLEGFKRVAMFYDAANNASVRERKLLEEHAGKLGYEVVAVESSPEGSTDVSSAVSKIAAAKPDAIFLSHLVPETAAFMKQARARGIDAVFVGGAPLASTEIFELAGKAGEGTLTYVPFLPGADTPEVKTFVDAFQQEYGRAPDQFAAQGYDAALVLFAAIEKAGSSDPQAIRDALAQLKEVRVATGLVSYDGGPDNTTPEVNVVRVEQGQFTPVD